MLFHALSAFLCIFSNVIISFFEMGGGGEGGVTELHLVFKLWRNNEPVESIEPNETIE